MTGPHATDDIKRIFFEECDELLDTMQDALAQLEMVPGDSEALNALFRAVHSVKGGAGAFALAPLVAFAHGVEESLQTLQLTGGAVDPATRRLLFAAVYHLSDLIAACRAGDPPPSDDNAILDVLRTYLATGGVEDQPSSRAPSVFDIHFRPLPELYENGNEPHILLLALQDLGSCATLLRTDDLPDLNDLLPEVPKLAWDIRLTTHADREEIAAIFEFVEDLCVLDIHKIQDAPQSDAAPAAPAALTAPDVSVRVDMGRIETLVNQVGELVINQSILAQNITTLGLSPFSQTMQMLDHYERLTRDIQDSVMGIRAQPVKSLFRRMARIVREASVATGKDVHLVTRGDATEVDKRMIERLAEPLTHLVRNAVDHGIEPAAGRASRNKPPQGKIRLAASHRSSRVLLEVSDDGNGLNRDRIYQKTVALGVIADGAKMDEADIDNLIFHPGLSTKSTVSDLSGRGVGMDAVQAAIRALGGRITVTSAPGKGCIFSLSLPLTLAVLEGMLVTVDRETMVLPLPQVSETLTYRPSDLHETQPGTFALHSRGRVLPTLDLGNALGMRRQARDATGGVALLITLHDVDLCALLVDDVIDQRQVVIKGLDETYHRAPGVAAATILGDGKIALIIDPPELIAHAQSRKRAPSLPDRSFA